MSTERPWDGSRLAVLAANVIIAVASVWLFFRTADPMILIFGVFAVLLVSVGAVVYRRWSSPSTAGAAAVVVRVKCRACGALNLEDAKFCSQCAQAM